MTEPQLTDRCLDLLASERRSVPDRLAERKAAVWRTLELTLGPGFDGGDDGGGDDGGDGGPGHDAAGHDAGPDVPGHDAGADVADMAGSDTVGDAIGATTSSLLRDVVRTAASASEVAAVGAKAGGAALSAKAVIGALALGAGAAGVGYQGGRTQNEDAATTLRQELQQSQVAQQRSEEELRLLRLQLEEVSARTETLDLPVAPDPLVAPADVPRVAVRPQIVEEIPVAVAPEPEPPSSAPVALDDLREDLLIARARVAFGQGRLHDSMLALMNHERRFANGTFAEERDRLAIDVLVRQGRRETAERRAQQFFVRYPRSIHRSHVESLFPQ